MCVYTTSSSGTLMCGDLLLPTQYALHPYAPFPCAPLPYALFPCAPLPYAPFSCAPLPYAPSPGAPLPYAPPNDSHGRSCGAAGCEVLAVEHLVLRSARKGRLATYVVCPGLLYGCGEDDALLHPLFR